MDNGLTLVGLTLLALFALIFLVLVVIAIVGLLRFAIGIVTGYFEHRSAEARRVTMIVPGLGEFTSTDNIRWFGDVDGLQVMLTTEGRPPDESDAHRVLAVVTDLPQLVDLGRKFLAENEDCEWLDGGAELFEAESLDVDSATDFSLTFGHPVDSDGMYWVQFRNGEPVESRRDD